jgi:DNA-binding transcriptional MerR regulator
MPEELSETATPARSIGAMCAEFGVTPRTLRFYETLGLLSPLRRGRRRLYTRRCAGRLSLILRGKRFGFSLEDIRQLLDLYDLGDQQVTQLARTCALGGERLAAMRAQRAELDLAIADLERQLATAGALLVQRSDPDASFAQRPT